MFQKSILLALSIGLWGLFCPFPINAQDPAVLLEINESLSKGYTAFVKEDWKKTEKEYRDYLSKYLVLVEGKKHERKVRNLLTISLLRQSDWTESIKFIEHFITNYPDTHATEDFAFWLGICHLKLKQWENGNKAFAKFAETYPRNPRAEDAILAAAVCLKELNKLQDLADYLKPKLTQLRPEIDSQAHVMVLRAFLELKSFDEAIDLVLKFDERAGRLIMIAEFQTLALQLGQLLFDNENYRKALLPLQRIWSYKRILTRQERKLEELKQRLEILQVRKADPADITTIETQVSRIQRETEAFKKVKGYDTAVQFRIFQCFYQMERWREAYLQSGGMLEELPDSERLVTATFQALDCLVNMERWQDVVRYARQFVERFPNDKLVPGAMYYEGEAYARMFAHRQAYEVFSKLHDKYPDFSEAQKSHFLAAYALLNLDENPKAIEMFDKHLKLYPQGGFLENVYYWKAMGYYYDKKYDKAREEFADYVKRYPNGEYVTDAEYRRGHSLYLQKKFEDALVELTAWLKKYPKSGLIHEAYNLIGDAHFAVGNIYDGLEYFEKTPDVVPRFYEYAYFRRGKAHKALEEYDKFREHFEAFVQDRGDSNRVPEAIAQLARYWRSKDQPEKAREIYWEAIREYGNDPESMALETMLKTLSKYYQANASLDEYEDTLIKLSDEARANDELTLSARARWMVAELQRKKFPARALRTLVEVAKDTPPRQLSPILLADTGDALREEVEFDLAEKQYRTILSWYPRSVLKNRAYAGLGLLASERGDPEKALRLFERFAQVKAGTSLTIKVLLTKAQIEQELGRSDAAVKTLNTILSVKAAKGRPWVDALLRLGDIYFEAGDFKKAINYYQRIYVLYSSWTEPTAKAYIQSAKAFQKLNEVEKAINTYAEFIGLEDDALRRTKEFELAQTELAQLRSSD